MTARNSTRAQRTSKPPTSLSFHAGSGHFVKKVKGRRFYLGKDHDEALATWERYEDSFKLGIDPRKDERAGGARLSLADAVNLYLEAQESRVEAGEIRERTFKDAMQTCKRMVAFFGRTIAVESMGPRHFTKYKADLASRNNVVTISNEITRARSVFIWLSDSSLIAKRPDFGPDFKRAKRPAIRRHRNGQEEKTLSPETIRSVLAELGVHYRAMALLGINAGFGPTDCMELPLDAVDLERGWIEYPRTKTAVERKCPLWPETLEALDLSHRCRPCPKGRGAKERFFLRHDGRVFAASCDKVTRSFSRALRIIGAYREGLSFYGLRHSMATIGRQVRDDEAVKRILGHVDDSMLSEHYTHHFPEPRLEAVTDHVRSVVFGLRRKGR